MISDKFLEATKNLKPSMLLTEALPYVHTKGRALDLGSGAFKDTRHLLTEGFSVDAVDNEPNVKEYAQGVEGMQFHPQSFDTYEFPTETYDLINAQYSLPFNSPDTFPEVWERIIASLKTGGIFTGQFFGMNDEWRASRPGMTFLTREQVEALFQGFAVHTFVESKRTKNTATGVPKFWHVYDVIAEKK